MVKTATVILINRFWIRMHICILLVTDNQCLLINQDIFWPFFARQYSREIRNNGFEREVYKSQKETCAGYQFRCSDLIPIRKVLI